MHPSRATSPYKPAPPRPAIPLALWCAAPLWAVTAVLVFFGWDWPAPVHRLLAFGGLAGIACTGLPFLRGVRRPLCAGIAGVCLGCLLAGSQALQWAADVADAGADRVGMQRAITLTADPSVGDYGSSAQGRMRLDSGRTVSVRVNLPEGLTAHCWDRILVTDAAHQPAEKARAFYAQRGWAGSVSPSTAEIVHPDGVRGAIADLRRLTVERFLAPATPGAFLLAALVCGDRTALFQNTAYDDIVTAGLAHMVAVSGAHLAIVSGIVGVLLMHAHIPRIGRSACMVAFMIAYALFAGCPVSVLRATVMAALALCAAFAKRRRNTLSALALCIIVFLSLEPCLALSVSFSLSCLSMLGIALFYPLAQKWMAALCRGHASGLSESLALTLAASLLTVPVSAPLFAQLSPAVEPPGGTGARSRVRKRVRGGNPYGNPPCFGTFTLMGMLAAGRRRALGDASSCGPPGRLRARRRRPHPSACAGCTRMRRPLCAMACAHPRNRSCGMPSARVRDCRRLRSGCLRPSFGPSGGPYRHRDQ